MNIFYLDSNPTTAAKYHCDKHVVKMIVEYAQLLSTAHRVLDGEVVLVETFAGKKKKHLALNDARENILYKATHANHPSAVWARQTTENYNWLYNLLTECLAEYTARYGKIHSVQRTSDNRMSLHHALGDFPKRLGSGEFSPPPQAMPEEYQQSDTVEAYRCFYNGSKLRFAKWKNGEPHWVKR